MKVILDMPKTMSPKFELAIMFEAFEKGALTKWEVYPAAMQMIADKVITIEDVKEIANKVCKIPSTVVDDRINYITKMRFQQDQIDLLKGEK